MWLWVCTSTNGCDSAFVIYSSLGDRLEFTFGVPVLDIIYLVSIDSLREVSIQQCLK